MYSLVSLDISGVTYYSNESIDKVKKYSMSFIRNLKYPVSKNIIDYEKHFLSKLQEDCNYKNCEECSLKNGSPVLANFYLQEYNLKIIKIN